MLQLLPDSTTTKLDRSNRDRGAGRVPREDSRRVPGKILPSAYPRGTPRQRAFSLLIRALSFLLIRSLLDFRPAPYAVRCVSRLYLSQSCNISCYKISLFYMSYLLTIIFIVINTQIFYVLTFIDIYTIHNFHMYCVNYTTYNQEEEMKKTLR